MSYEQFVDLINMPAALVILFAVAFTLAWLGILTWKKLRSEHRPPARHRT